MKTSYFAHDRDARSDPKIMRMRRKYGMEGYGIFFALLEMLYSDSKNQLPYSDEQFDSMAYDFHTGINMRQYVDDCVEYELFDTDGEVFWSPSMRRRIAEQEAKTKSKSEARAAAARARWNKAKGVEQEPEQIPESLAAYDQEWLKVVQSYESEIGMMPVGTTLETIQDYYKEIGADIIVLAIQETNKAGASSAYLLKILKSWTEAGVRTVAQAKASIRDHERRRNGYRRGDSEPQEPPPAIRGGWY